MVSFINLTAQHVAPLFLLTSVSVCVCVVTAFRPSTLECVTFNWLHSTHTAACHILQNSCKCDAFKDLSMWPYKCYFSVLHIFSLPPSLPAHGSVSRTIVSAPNLVHGRGGLSWRTGQDLVPPPQAGQNAPQPPYPPQPLSMVFS